jgi:hypothetical protein
VVNAKAQRFLIQCVDAEQIARQQMDVADAGTHIDSAGLLPSANRPRALTC